VPQKSKTWEGFNYSLNQEKYLKVFLDDGEVPLANLDGGHSGKVMGYLPIYIGIGAVAVLALAGTAVYLKKRRKAPAITAEKVIEELTDREK